jgi:predicted Mrr-cat superfamily restriction endonuclease
VKKKYKKLWVMHSGVDNVAHSDFVDKRYVSLGWAKLRDLRLIPRNRKAFHKKFRKYYHDDPRAATRVQASELYRFVHLLQRKEIVVYPSGGDDLVRVGHIEGDYEYKPRLNRKHPHVRKISWFRVLKRKSLPLAVRISLSLPQALYNPRENLDQIRRILLDDSQ